MSVLDAKEFWFLKRSSHSETRRNNGIVFPFLVAPNKKTRG